MKIERIIELGYYPVSACCVGEGAQIVEGQWYMPKWGCDTLQHIIDSWDITTPHKKHQCHVCKVEVGEKHLPFCSVGNDVFHQ